MRVRAIALAGLVLVGLVVLVSGAGAAGKPTRAACTLKFTVTLSPGINRTPSGGTLTSSGGTSSCRGTVGGASATGKAGGITVTGTYGPADTCNTGKGKFTYSASVPTSAGTKTVSGSGTFTRVGAAGTFKASANDGAGNTATANGGFSFVPQGSNCVTTTVTKANVNGAAAFSG
jgi:hypothetical protein